MDIELEQKDNNLYFLKDRIGIPDSKIVEELKRLGLNKISSKHKSDRNMNRFNKTLKNHKSI